MRQLRHRQSAVPDVRHEQQGECRNVGGAGGCGPRSGDTAGREPDYRGRGLLAGAIGFGFRTLASIFRRPERLDRQGFRRGVGIRQWSWRQRQRWLLVLTEYRSFWRRKPRPRITARCHSHRRRQLSAMLALLVQEDHGQAKISECDPIQPGPIVLPVRGRWSLGGV